ncbi:hypothetical protein [Eubacterium ramulus]|uniref:hypothetical protein n=1 Tax=Eubacterium ramulus TaxID=39490 RepID=UPI00399B975E
MAWNAERKRRHWHCINGWNAILWYDEFLYNQWWNSLTDEEQEKVKEYKRKKREREEYEFQQMLSRIDLIFNTFADSAYRNYYVKSWMRDL